MEEVVKGWLFDPLVGKLVAALVAGAVIFGVARFLQRSVTRYIQMRIRPSTLP